MLKKIRRLLAVLCFVAVTLLFLDFTGALHHWLGWAAKVQFFPAVLAANFIIVAVLVLLTLVFGRIYCSVVCPLGVMQDLISWLHGKRKKNRFTYSKEVKCALPGAGGLYRAGDSRYSVFHGAEVCEEIGFHKHLRCGDGKEILVMRRNFSCA